MHCIMKSFQFQRVYSSTVRTKVQGVISESNSIKVAQPELQERGTEFTEFKICRKEKNKQTFA